jgi:hypothetical protein
MRSGSAATGKDNRRATADGDDAGGGEHDVEARCFRLASACFVAKVTGSPVLGRRLLVAMSLLVVVGATSCAGGDRNLDAALVRREDLSGRWTQRAHDHKAEGGLDAALGTCLGVTGRVTVAERVSGADFTRQSDGMSEQVSSTATRWGSRREAELVHGREDGSGFTECVRAWVERQARANPTLPV